MSHGSEETLPRIDELLMRVLDGEASAAQRAELLALADADARLSPLVALRERLREAVMEEVGQPEEVVGEVLAALAIDDGWDLTAVSLRDALKVESPPDLSDSVLQAILEPDPDAALSALVDGEVSVEQRLALAKRLMDDREAHQVLAEYAEIGRMLRESTQRVAGPSFDGVWEGVAKAIGLDDPDYVPGWEPLGVAVRESVLAEATLSPQESARLTGAILNALPRTEEAPAPVVAPRVPWWRSLLQGPVFGAAALAAAAVLLLNLPAVREEPTSPTSPELAPQLSASADGELKIGTFNQIEVESLEVAPDVMVQVVQLEDGAPVLLMIDEDSMVEGATL